MPRRVVTVVVCSVLALASCAKRKENDRAQAAPLGTAEIPGDIRIPVFVDNAPADPVTAVRLRALRPDFVDGDRSAWKLSSVFGELFSGDAVVEAEGPGGVALTLRPAESDPAPQAVIALTRRSQLAAAVVDPRDPFPTYHGSGGRERRPKDPLPRVFPIQVFRFYTGRMGASPPGVLTGLAHLDVVVDGEPLDTWTPVAASRLPTRTVQVEGEPRDAWSLRAIAALAGRARVTAIVGSDHRVMIDDAAWNDPTRTPILRTNRRGTDVKFQWVDAQGVAGEVAARGVRQIILSASEAASPAEGKP